MFLPFWVRYIHLISLPNNAIMPALFNDYMHEDVMKISVEKEYR